MLGGPRRRSYFEEECSDCPVQHGAADLLVLHHALLCSLHSSAWCRTNVFLCIKMQMLTYNKCRREIGFCV